MDPTMRAEAVRLVLRWLRHRPQDVGLKIEGDGWASIDSIALALERAGYTVDASEVALMAHGDQRRKLEVEGQRMRARYGHSIEMDAPAHESAPPSVLYAAVPPRFAERIAAVGLRPVKRRFVHLYVERRVAAERASRRGVDPLVLAVAASDAHAAGVRFYPRGAGVWLSDPLSPDHLTPVRRARGATGEGGAEPDEAEPRRERRVSAGPLRRRPRHSPRRR
ncbi:MAG TPA: RNA 2'-phosphotransferase [Chthonomonadales bacterium]|nr:RNA 2'-phosphotransferase [Chthonomonadales bacterium]